jgi:hypothetical protein
MSGVSDNSGPKPVDSSNLSGPSSGDSLNQRVDAVASALFFKTEFQPYRGSTGRVHSYTQSEIPERLEQVKKEYQDFAGEVGKCLGLEGLIEDFNLENGRLEYYPPDALDDENRPLQGAKTQVLFVSQELKKIDTGSSSNLREKANKVLASHQKLIDENKKPPAPSTTKRKAFILGPKQFGVPVRNSFEKYPSDFKELQKIISCGGTKDPVDQVEWVIRYLENKKISISEQAKAKAIADYCLEFEFQLDSPNPNIGKILAFLDVSPDVLRDGLIIAINEEMPLLSFSKGKLREQKQEAMEKFIAECKGYSDKPELLEDFLQYYRNGSDFPLIQPIGFFKQEGGFEEFSDDEQMKMLAEPYKEFEGYLFRCMTSRSSSSYREAIIKKFQVGDKTTEGILTSARQYEASIVAHIKTFSKPNCTLDELKAIERDPSLYKLSGIQKDDPQASFLDGTLLVDNERIGNDFRLVMKIYVSLSLLNEKKVLKDLSPDEIFKLFNSFIFKNDKITSKEETLAPQAPGQIQELKAFWPLKGEDLQNAIKTAAFKLFKANQTYTLDNVPPELEAIWYDELKKTTADPQDFMKQKKSLYESVQKFVESGKPSITQKERDFLSMKLLPQFKPIFEGNNKKNLEKILGQLNQKKAEIQQTMQTQQSQPLADDQVLDLAIRYFDRTKTDTDNALKDQRTGTSATIHPPLRGGAP